MNKFKMKPLLIAIGLSCIGTTVLAQVKSPKLEVNSIMGDRVVAAVSFDAEVTGDVYLATEVGGTLFFLTPGNNFNTAIVPYAKNVTAPPNQDFPVLDAPSDGIAPGKYPLFQVVAVSGSDPLNFNNWIGGINGLNKIEFNINLTNTVPDVTPTPSPVPTGGPVPTPAPTDAPVPTPAPTDTPAPTPPPAGGDAVVGKAKYKSLGCSAGGCHKADPAANANRVLLGKTVPALKVAITKFPSDMGFLGDPADPQFASDADLAAVAAYLSTF